MYTYVALKCEENVRFHFCDISGSLFLLTVIQEISENFYAEEIVTFLSVHLKEMKSNLSKNSPWLNFMCTTHQNEAFPASKLKHNWAKLIL